LPSDDSIKNPAKGLAHIIHPAKQVSKKNVLGAAFTNQASDTLCILMSYIDMFHINA